jgi:hypothetical protein
MRSSKYEATEAASECNPVASGFAAALAKSTREAESPRQARNNLFHMTERMIQAERRISGKPPTSLVRALARARRRAACPGRSRAPKPSAPRYRGSRRSRSGRASAPTRAGPDDPEPPGGVFHPQTWRPTAGRAVG